MAITDNYVPVKQLGNGVTTNYSANWPVFAASYIRVYLENVVSGVQVLQVLGTDYSLVFDDSGFTVTFLPGKIPTNANYVVIGRQVAMDQTVPYTTSQGFQGEKVENSLDEIVAMIQDASDMVERALKFKLGSSAFGELPDPVDDATLAWDGITGGMKNGPTTGAIAAAATNAAIAQAAAAEATQAAGSTRYRTARFATTTNDTLSGLAARNGVTPIAGDLVLVPAQSAPAQNGLYVAAAGAWTRAVVADTWDELVGSLVSVQQGTLKPDMLWLCTVDSGGVLGTTAVTYEDLPTVLTKTALAAQMLFARANILGSVSQASGVPTGAIIERGSNVNGTYVKFADGTMICETVTGFAMDTTTANGGIFLTTSPLVWTFPVPFIAAPKICAAVSGSGARWATGATTSTTQTSLRQFSGVTSAVAVATEAMAVGRWF